MTELNTHRLVAFALIGGVLLAMGCGDDDSVPDSDSGSTDASTGTDGGSGVDGSAMDAAADSGTLDADGAASDGGAGDGGLADGGFGDSGLGDGGLADGAPSDVGLVDAAPPDGGLADGGADAGPAGDAGPDSGSGSDAGVDADDDPDMGIGDGLCPRDMLLIPEVSFGVDVCIDRYEASQTMGGTAQSVAGVLPWSTVSIGAASDACRAVDKRLCTEDEWNDACRGASGDRYPYGRSFIGDACNGVENGVGAAVNTGSMTSCEGGYPGLFDMSGNVWEWTSRCRFGMCPMQGGSFGNPESRLDCNETFQADSTFESALVGFRCCVDP